jgi:hypothetical protein
MGDRLRYGTVFTLSYLIGVLVWLALWLALPISGVRPGAGLGAVADVAHQHAVRITREKIK